jgi:flagellin
MGPLVDPLEKIMSTVVDSRTTLVALQGLKSANADASRASERLATGLRINRAGDDPAGLAKAATLKAELGSYQQVKRNINSALADIEKVTDGLTSITDYLVEMRTIALASASEADAATKSIYKATFDELVQGITDIVSNIKVGDTEAALSAGGTATVHVGVAGADTKSLAFSAISTATLGVSTLDVSAGAAAALTAVNLAINSVSTTLAKVGGYQKSLEVSSDLADSNILSRTAQYGDIMNADLALEASNLAAAKIRQDASTAVLAQANSMNRNIADYLLNGALG